MEKENVRLAKQIRFIRELEGFSQESIANYLGISQQAYQKMESGKGRICEERLKEIASFLSIDPIKLRNLNREDILLGLRVQKQKKMQLKTLKEELLSIQKSLMHLNHTTIQLLNQLEPD